MAQLIRIKRADTANKVPPTLADGELAVDTLADPPKMYVGTASTVKRLFEIVEIEDAPDDAVYGRSDGEWIAVPIVAAAAPVDPAPNALWFDSSNGRLYIFHQAAWVEVA